MKLKDCPLHMRVYLKTFFFSTSLSLSLSVCVCMCVCVTYEQHVHLFSSSRVTSSRSLCGQVRPYLMADGGNVSVLEIDGLVVRLKLEGACGSCPSSTTTMKMGIEVRKCSTIPLLCVYIYVCVCVSLSHCHHTVTN